MTDLNRDHPAPWRVVDEGDGNYAVVDASDRYVPGLDHFSAQSKPVASRIVLEHNAGAIMMERGWHPLKVAGGWWVDATHDKADDQNNWHHDAFQTWLYKQCWPDPFTAIVEADAWLREHEATT